ncbi:MAG: hypothetical protein HY786_08600 [Deltaproteobacteria bacterium]|nr:hypothetical protein [Deltaproteobacteria bacterium]
MKGITFDEALELVESLPEEQRETLVEIIKRRLIEERKNKLARSIKKGREEFASGKIRKGNLEDLMRELSK